jgi:hypothetical protein
MAFIWIGLYDGAKMSKKTKAKAEEKAEGQKGAEEVKVMCNLLLKTAIQIVTWNKFSLIFSTRTLRPALPHPYATDQ